MASKKTSNWMQALGKEIGQRMELITNHIAKGTKDMNFMPPPAPTPKPDLQAFLQASPEERQAYLQNLPSEDYAKTVSALQNEANSRYGAMASVLGPMFEMTDANIQASKLSMMHGPAAQMEQNLGMAHAHADLAEMLGMDPWAQEQ